MSELRNKNEQIYSYLRAAIKSGEYKPGQLLPTDTEVAKKFNASRPTVAKAVNRLKEERLIGRRAGYGTFVLDRDAGVVMVFGLLIPDLGETEIFEPICGRIAALAEENNFSLIWGGGGSVNNISNADSAQLAKRYVEQGVNGVFFTPFELIPDCGKINNRILAEFRQAGIPVILLDSDIVSPPASSDYDLVGIDNIEAGFVVAKHLIDQGCGSLGFVNRPWVAQTVAQRIMGAREAAQQAGSKFAILEMSDQMSGFAGRLVKDGMPDGIICFNDATAGELLVELLGRGVKIPEDVRIAGFDDVKYARMFGVPLTTYKQPCEGIGTAAVETMMARIKYPNSAPRRIQLKGALIKRRSS